MILFWSLSALLIGGALLAILLPLWCTKATNDNTKNNITAQLQKQQLDELQQEFNNGLIAETELIAAQKELAEGYALSNKLSATSTIKNKHSKTRVAPIATLILLPALAGYLYLQLGHPELINPKAAPQMASETNQQSQLNNIILRLKERLQLNPDDAKGWMLLGRSNMLIESYQEAVIAFQYASTMVTDNSQLMADYAEAIVLSNNNHFNEKIKQLIQQALELQPNNAKALWLAGVEASYLENEEQALIYWRRLLPLLDPQSEQATVLKDYIDSVETTN